MGRGNISIVTIPGPYVGPHELGVMFGVSRQRVAQLTGRADFPEPIATLKMGKVWRTEDVVRWAEAKGRAIRPLDADD